MSRPKTGRTKNNPRSFKFSDNDLELLEKLAERTGMSKTDTLMLALNTLAKLPDKDLREAIGWFFLSRKAGQS